jgi:hypothetical protein
MAARLVSFTCDDYTTMANLNLYSALTRWKPLGTGYEISIRDLIALDLRADGVYGRNLFGKPISQTVKPQRCL